MAEHEATPAEVREWARQNGHEIGQRGRISAEIAEAYRVATGSTMATKSEG